MKILAVLTIIFCASFGLLTLIHYGLQWFATRGEAAKLTAWARVMDSADNEMEVEREGWTN